MDGEGFDTVLSELLDNAIATVLGTTEHEYLLGSLLLDDVSQEATLVALHYEHQGLFYDIEGNRFRCD